MGEVDFVVSGLRVLEAEPREHTFDEVRQAFDTLSPACKVVDRCLNDVHSREWEEDTRIRLAMSVLRPDGFVGSYSETLDDVRIMLFKHMTRSVTRPQPCFYALSERVHSLAKSLSPVLRDDVEGVPFAVRDCARAMQLADEVMQGGHAKKKVVEPLKLTPVVSELVLA